MKTAAVFFDVDGVLIDSLNAKGDAFAELFPPQHRDRVLEFHRANGGLNRVDKIKRISSEIVGAQLTSEEVNALVGRFSSVVRARVLAADEVPGASQALAALSDRFPLHAVSAVPTTELQEILHGRGILHFFTSVHGVPPVKAVTLTSLMRQHGYLSERCLFVGDSLHDRDAAVASSVPFIFVRSSGQQPPPEAVAAVDDLRGLDSFVVELMSGG